jgi:hypothetical protein
MNEPVDESSSSMLDLTSGAPREGYCGEDRHGRSIEEDALPGSLTIGCPIIPLATVRDLPLSSREVERTTSLVGSSSSNRRL